MAFYLINLMKKFLFFALLAPVLFTACSEQQAFHTFEFNSPPGFVEDDTRVVEKQLLSSGQVYADIIIETCKQHQTFGSGLRMNISNMDNSPVLVLGISCIADTGEQFADWLLLEGNLESSKVLEQKHFPLSGKVGTSIPVSIKLENRKFIFATDENTFTLLLGFEPQQAWFFSFGTKGNVRFYTKEP